MKKGFFIAIFCAVAVIVIAVVGFTVSASRETALAPTARPTATPELRAVAPEKTDAEDEIDRLLREIEDFTAPPAQWFTPDPATVAHEYVLNTNTKIFHSPKCRYVAYIDAGNAETVWQSRDELIAAGYDPCGVCNP